MTLHNYVVYAAMNSNTIKNIYIRRKFGVWCIVSANYCLNPSPFFSQMVFFPGAESHWIIYRQKTTNKNKSKTPDTGTIWVIYSCWHLPKTHPFWHPSLRPSQKISLEKIFGPPRISQKHRTSEGMTECRKGFLCLTPTIFQLLISHIPVVPNQVLPSNVPAEHPGTRQFWIRFGLSPLLLV